MPLNTSNRYQPNTPGGRLLTNQRTGQQYRAYGGAAAGGAGNVENVYYPTRNPSVTRQPTNNTGVTYDAAGYPVASNEKRQLASDLRGRLQNPTPVVPPPMPGRETLPAREAAPSLKGLMEAGGAAILARAKENQGNIARSAVNGLRAALGERGVLGSGIEANATQNIAANALSSLTDVNREQLIQQDEAARRFAELGYTGGIQQRGQDIGAGVQQRGQDISGRGQDIQALLGNQSNQNTQLQTILDALRGLVY